MTLYGSDAYPATPPLVPPTLGSPSPAAALAAGAARARSRRARRASVPIALAIVLLLTVALGTALDRLRPADPYAVRPISPRFTMLAVPAAPAAATAARAAPAPNPLSAVPGCPAPPRLPTSPATAGTAAGALLDVYDAPTGHLVRTLTNPTRERQVLHVLVLERRGFWLHVRLPVRPNETTGWVPLSQLTTSPAPFRLLVERCAHRITALRAGKVVWQRPVAVGKPSTPTPAGSFYVDFVTPMRPTGAYGPFLLSVAGFSDVLHQWGNGGIGQIALHGTNQPGLIGTSASHGCVRLNNADVTYLAHLVPPGTPVTVV